MREWKTAVLVLIAAGIAGCLFPSGESGCGSPGFPAVSVRVRDESFRPAGSGTKLVARDGNYADSAVGEYGYQVSTIGVADNRAGDYTIYLTRPGFIDAEIPNVHVPGNQCGAIATVTVERFIHSDPAAPLPRQLAVLPDPAELRGAGLALQYHAWVETNGGADTTVTWAIDDTTVATITPAGGLISKCRTQDGTAVVTATSVSNPQKRAYGHLIVSANAKAC